MISIKTSELNKERVQTFATKFQIVRSENVVARIALTYSLSKGRKLSISKDLKDNKGKEYKKETLFGKYESFYIALICQYYDIYKDSPDVEKFVKMHLDDGLELMDKFFEANGNYNAFDFLIQNIERGIESIEHTSNSFNAVENSNPSIGSKSGFANLLKLNIGSDTEGGAIECHLNDTSKYNNSHIAIAGQSGSGKTQFALELLYQIAQVSNGQTNFVYLDFKGLNNEDAERLRPFFSKTNTELINAPQKTFPLNPLGFIDNVNETNKKLGISKFVDIIASYYHTGTNQTMQLKDAVKTCFSNKKSGQYPTMSEIYEEVKNSSDADKSKLLRILEGLSDYNIFADESNKEFLNKNYYFSLSGNLPDDIRFTSIFLIINYIFQQFMTMSDAPVVKGNRAMRYVLLIDEAQIVFRDHKAKEILQVILEQIRSRGVAVVLLAQNIKEFNQPTFDFSSLCALSFLLDVKDKNNLKLINKFLGFSDIDAKKVMKSMEKIQAGQAISNLKEFKKGELFNVSQFWQQRK